MPSKPSVVHLHQLQPGPAADFFALLADKQPGTTRDGKPYFACKFRDLRRTVSVMVWQDSKEFAAAEAWQPGGFFKVRGTFTEHEKYGPQVDVLQIREVRDSDRADGFREADFYDRSRFDSDAMLAELRAVAEKEIRDDPLRRLVLGLLDTHADKLMRLPATERHFYPFPGGWLEHVLNVTKNCLFLADRYITHYPDLTPPLNRDLIVSAAVLHDIGRVEALRVPEVPGQPVELTVDGHLFGPIALGRDLIRTAAAKVPDLNPELLRLLEHTVLTHLSLPEWGSPRLPVIPEVLVLHHADDLDAKMEMFARCLMRDNSTGPFTDHDPVLKKPLLKKREV
ncbi:MAG: HD domain-containing protein [Fimbriiglobus sp.]|jgi:3'-5' exoribonuclease|nr:HD domain-containing protein [Fimbriiglobus sp.]